MWMQEWVAKRWKGRMRVACVHTLCRAYKVSQLLVEDLAEHMLLQLASMMTSPATESDTWSHQQLSSMKESIITLIKTSGEETLQKVRRKWKRVLKCSKFIAAGLNVVTSGSVCIHHHQRRKLAQYMSWTSILRNRKQKVSFIYRQKRESVMRSQLNDSLLVTCM